MLQSKFEDLDSTIKKNKDAAGETLEISEGLSDQADQLKTIISQASGAADNSGLDLVDPNADRSDLASTPKDAKHEDAQSMELENDAMASAA